MSARAPASHDGTKDQPAAEPGTAIEVVEHLHQTVDEMAEPLARLHAGRMCCSRGCAACCIDGITVFAVEAAFIRHSAAAVLLEKPHPPGRCAFLAGDESCRIYPFRPYVCRTQGLPLRYFEPGPEGEVVEFRDICPLNDPHGPPVEHLPEEQLWVIGPIEGRLAQAQHAFSEDQERVALRDLFTPASVRASFDGDGEPERSAGPEGEATPWRR